MKRFLLAAVAIPLAIPLTSPTGWQHLKFKKIPPNDSSFAATGLEVKVARSSSPLIYPLPTAAVVTGFTAELEIDGEMKAKDGFPEDAYLRVGLVAPGDRRLNGFERMMATDWLKRLFELAPKDGGVDKVYFFNIADRALGESREFPGSKGLMREKIIAVRRAEKTLNVKYDLEKPIPVVALWLSIDGDNSKSDYVLRLKNLKLETKPQDPEKSE